MPCLPQQPGSTKRPNAAGPLTPRAIEALAGQVPTRHDGLQLIGSTPLPRAAPRKTVTRSKPAGHAGHGYRGSHGRFFRDVRL